MFQRVTPYAVGLLIFLLLAFSDPLYQLGRSIENFSRVMAEIFLHYVDEVDPDTLSRKAIDRMLEELDRYTQFYAGSEIEKARLQQSGQYSGVGIQVLRWENHWLIQQVLPQSPAEQAGIQAGDLLRQVEKYNADTLTDNQIQALLMGADKTPVRLTIWRPAEQKTFSFTLLRENLELPKIPYEKILPGDIGYIPLLQFGRGAAQKVRQTLLHMKNQRPLRGLILDLRGNPGGLLQEAIDILNLFLPKGEILLQTKGRMTESNQTYIARDHPLEPTLPLVVLIDEESASASEIIAGTLQDLDRAVIIGRRSFGKGLVQTIRPISENTQLKITVSRYYTPSGRCIQAAERQIATHRLFRTKKGRPVRETSGITPDIFIPAPIPPEKWEYLHPYFLYAISLQASRLPKDTSTLLEWTPSATFWQTLWDTLQKYPNAWKTPYEEDLQRHLIEPMRTESFFPDLEPALAQLRKKLQQAFFESIRQQAPQLTPLIGEMVAATQIGLGGKYLYLTRHDPTIQKALEILGDQTSYEKILQP
ncbi:MAG: S41 family peptidase [Bacteroidia bacterium]